MNVLISPLNWGLGHATRVVPLIHRMLEEGHNIFIAGSGQSLEVLKNALPDRVAERALPLHSFSPRLSHVGCLQWLVIALQLPYFFFCIVWEYVWTQHYVRKHAIDLIISDNRYGLRSARCRSLLVTHQLQPRIASCRAWFVRLLESIVARVLQRYIAKFDECLVPDTATDGTGLSGELSRADNPKIKVRAIGILSRMPDMQAVRTSDESHICCLGIVSGPEPQCTKFKNALLTLFSKTPGRHVIVCGDTDAESLSRDIVSAKHVVCRAGYSTIMDLVKLGKKAILVPTPGQAEQEYLARHMSEKFGFQAVTQRELKKLVL